MTVVLKYGCCLHVSSNGYFALLLSPSVIVRSNSVRIVFPHVCSLPLWLAWCYSFSPFNALSSPYRSPSRRRNLLNCYYNKKTSSPCSMKGTLPDHCQVGNSFPGCSRFVKTRTLARSLLTQSLLRFRSHCNETYLRRASTSQVLVAAMSHREKGTPRRMS